MDAFGSQEFDTLSDATGELEVEDTLPKVEEFDVYRIPYTELQGLSGRCVS